MKYKNFVFAFLIFTTSLSFAGQEGGGGAGVVCKKRGKISSVRLLDLYDAELNEGNIIPRSDLPINQQMTYILKKTDKYFRYDLHTELKRISLNYLPENVTQVQPYDFGDIPIVIEDNCSIEWLAFYKDTSKSLQIVTKYFNKMSPTDQAALLIHEAIYRIRRKNLEEKNSYRSQRIVAAFFASNISSADLEELTVDMRVRANEIIISNLFNQIVFEIEKDPLSFPVPSGAIDCYDSDWNYLEHNHEILGTRTGSTHIYKISGVCRYLKAEFHGILSYRMFINDVFVMSGFKLHYLGGRLPPRSYEEYGFTFTIYPPGLE